MKRALLLLGLSTLWLGCPPKRIEFGPTGRIEDPQALLQLVAANERKVLTLEGESKVRVDTPDAKGAFSMFVAVARPNRLHLEPLDFFGRPQAVLVVDEDQFGLYQAQDNRYYRGPASPENVSRFLPIALPAAELAQIMLGQVPALPPEGAELELGEKCRCYVVTLRRGSITQRLEIDPRLLRVVKSEVRGVDSYDLEMDDFIEQGEITFPRRIRLRSRAAKVYFDLRYKEVTLNQTPDPIVFDLSPPEDVPVVDVDVQGRPRQSDVPPPSGPELTPVPEEDAEQTSPELE